MRGEIKAQEIYLKDLMGSKFLFEIPDFQRPYSWDKDNFEQLIDDIWDAISVNQASVGTGTKLAEYEPYFLGSIILWTKELNLDDSGRYAVIDGQQRLISLAILFAVLRDLTDNVRFSQSLQNSIYQEEDVAKGLPDSVRIKVRSKEHDFFHKYILESGGTKLITNVDIKDLTEPKARMVQAVDSYSGAFMNDNNQPDQKKISLFIQYLLQKVAVVYVRTDSLASGFRLFNVINTRGLSLSNSDLLKSDNLSQISDVSKREWCTKTWEDIEEEIGSEDLEMLISFIRSIKLKDRVKKNIFEEFQNRVYNEDPQFRGEQFVQYLKLVKTIYTDKIKDAALNTQNSDLDTYYYNLVSIMRDFLPFNDWMTAVIKFKEKFPNNQDLYHFVTSFEKMIVVDWVSGYSFSERLTQIYKVMRVIEAKDKAEEVLSDPILNQDRIDKMKYFVSALDDSNFYSKGRSRMPKYILLRLDMEKKYNHNKITAYTGQITVEHILPQSPTNSYWTDRFSETQVSELKHKLGNLALLNSRKNPQASNKAFPEKYKTYFEKSNDFVLTEELKLYCDWTSESLRDRHENLINAAKSIWVE